MHVDSVFFLRGAMAFIYLTVRYSYKETDGAVWLCLCVAVCCCGSGRSERRGQHRCLSPARPLLTVRPARRRDPPGPARPPPWPPHPPDNSRRQGASILELRFSNGTNDVTTTYTRSCCS